MKMIRCNALPALLLAVLLAAPAVAVPPPPEQIAADCDSPTYASDMLVCGDPLLRGLDARLRDAWTAVDFAGVVAQRAWVEAQPDWFKRRSLCAFSERHAECLRAAYIERAAVLEALRLVASHSPPPGSRWVCHDAPWGNTGVRLRTPATGALTIEDGDARVLAAATPLRPGEAWTPYVGFQVEGALVRLALLDGTTIVCSPLDQRGAGGGRRDGPAVGMATQQARYDLALPEASASAPHPDMHTRGD